MSLGWVAPRFQRFKNIGTLSDEEKINDILDELMSYFCFTL